jgi:predicted DsbA family dithiol-disulfide isomerase
VAEPRGEEGRLVKVEIWSDIVCPWCYVGKRRFERALERFPHRDEVEVVWRSFELDPHAPARQPGTSVERLAKKYGMSLAQARASNERLAAAGAELGLVLDFDRTQSGNTFDAHRLLHLAAERGVQDAVKERLLRAYFSEGEPIGDPDALVRLVSEAGLDADEARAVLQGDAYSQEVGADEEQAAAFGITGVPFFVLDRRYGVSGAQAPEVLLGALQQAWADAHPIQVLTPVGGGEAAACEGDSCAI